jgi:transcription factor 1
MSLLFKFASSRRCLHSLNLCLLRSSRPEIPHSRCNSSSSRVFQLDPLLAEVLSSPERTLVKPLPTNLVDLAKADLPHRDEWRKTFPPLLATAHRVSIQNPRTAGLLADAFIPRGSEGKIVIEAFPGTSFGTVSFGCGIS